MSPTLEGVLTLAALFVGALLAMVLGWRARARRSAALVQELPPVPPDGALGAPLSPPASATYVSTTVAGDWLDRVVAHDLGARSAATVQVHQAGVLIARTGARDVFIPAPAVVGVERAPGIAGKYVGGDGLVVIRWECTDASGTAARALDTGLRVRRAADRPLLTAAVATLLERRHADHPSTEETR